jgi:hypothetical protein
LGGKLNYIYSKVDDKDEDDNGCDGCADYDGYRESDGDDEDDSTLTITPGFIQKARAVSS